MSIIHLDDLELNTYGELPEVGQSAPDFNLAATDLSSVSLNDFYGKALLLNVYPSIDTDICFESVKKFSKIAAENKKSNVEIICVSMDLPFALKRVAAAEGFVNPILLSDYRNRDFGNSYGVTIANGPLAGLLARAVIVLDSDHRVVYRELVKDINQHPDYEKALNFI